MNEFQRQHKILTRGVAEVLPEEEFSERLKKSIETGVPLRVKQGFDPTSPDIHLGHSVGMRKLRQFQELGHQIVLIVGDYTALVGDPSGRSSTRPLLSHEEILVNARTYQDQFFRILDRAKTEVRYNGEWFKGFSLLELIRLASKYTVARMLEREDFDNRLKNNIPISVHELLYPLMQGYDSVVIKADLEIGATEQKFNLLVGRALQPDYKVTPQMILTMPILVGLDGKKKMSKSYGNYIGIDEPPGQIFGKVMSIPDELIASYAELASDYGEDELGALRSALATPGFNPMSAKKDLAERFAAMYSDAQRGKSARDEFERVFSRKEIPEDMPVHPCAEYNGSVGLVRLLMESGVVKSNSDARRLIAAGAVSIDGEKVLDPMHTLDVSHERILKVGKLHYRRLTP